MMVLIDTWWNVNFHTDTAYNVSFLSFNRYMVECELIRASVIFLMLKVLIDTWWNVNCAAAGLPSD